MSMTTRESERTKLFAIADALGMDLRHDKDKYEIHGTTKRLIEVFEGYSPTICPTIESSTVSMSSGVIAAQGQIWGNLGFVITAEEHKNMISFFVYDRSKTPESKNCTPFTETGWSRKRLYYWLGQSCKAIYYRSIFDTKWSLLEQGPKRLAKYNSARDKHVGARKAYDAMWEDLL